MAQPQMPHIPGAAVMNDTLDFMKNLWGSMGVPGITTPTLSVDELDKKINDLKAVEAWLNLNMSMLRGSIQALEVQRNTIATLKSVGASLAAAVNQATTQTTAPGAPAADHKSIFDANPYTSAFFQHARDADQKPAAPQAPSPSWPSAPPAAAPTAAEAPKAPPAAADKADATAGASALWWNLLQDQFKQAVSTAVASESMMADAAARATETAVKFAAATAVKPEPAAPEQATTAPAAAAPDQAGADKKPAAKRAPARPAKPASGK